MKPTDRIGLFDCQFEMHRTFAEAGTLDVFVSYCLQAMKDSSCDVLARAHTIWGLGAKRLVLTVRVT